LTMVASIFRRASLVQAGGREYPRMFRAVRNWQEKMYLLRGNTCMSQLRGRERQRETERDRERQRGTIRFPECALSVRVERDAADGIDIPVCAVLLAEGEIVAHLNHRVKNLSEELVALLIASDDAAVLRAVVSFDVDGSLEAAR
jgi:hypothetical protein